MSATQRPAGRAWLVVALLALATLAAGRPGGAAQGVPGADPAPAIAADQRGEFDVARGQRHALLPAPAGIQLAEPGGGKARTVSDLVVRMDALTGSASRVRRSSGGALTGRSRQAPATIARGFFRANPTLFRLTEADVSGLQVSRQLDTEDLGIAHVTLQPVYQGIPVLQAEVKCDVRATGELLAVSGAAVPDLRATINTRTPALSARQALRLAARAAGMQGAALEAGATAPVRAEAGGRHRTLFTPGAQYARPPVLQLAYLPVRPGETRLAWETTLWRRGESDVFQVVVDAVTGQVLLRNNYTDEAQGQVFNHESPQDGSPFGGTDPPVLDRVVAPFDGNSFYPAGDPHRDWWAGAAPSTTDSNNAVAGSFRNGQDYLVAGGTNGTFNFGLSLSQNPTSYRQAAIVNLFYWVNRCHDLWYPFGFNEAAGNFQRNNFGLGGRGDDAIVANTQFGADLNPPKRNNANFSTPPDGQSGEMRMFEFDVTNPFRDSDLSADVIAHEFGHGLTNRLIGNAGGLNGFQGGALGEGWSDFQALMVHAQPGDDLTLPHPVGGWLLRDFARGIRSQPYSATRANFNRTFGDLGEEVPKFGPEIHLAGEIICNALFQTYGRFVQRLGFDTGRGRAMQLFIDACKLCPSNPTYLDFRDAYLAADQNRFGGADQADIWFAFAAHGMGVNASTTGVEDVHPVEDFTTPGGGNPDTPRAPSNFRAVLTGTDQVDCTWIDNANNESGFLLEYSINSDPFAELPQIQIGLNTTSIHLSLTGFNPGDVLALRIKAINAAGKSPVSNTSSITIPGGPAVPNAPSDFDAAIFDPTTADCSWVDNSDNETKFLLEVSTNLGPWTPQPQIDIPANSSFLRVTLSGFTEGDQVAFRVRAVNGDGESLPSNSDTIVVPGAPPTAPSNFAAVLQAVSAVKCTWIDNATDEDGFLLEASVNGGQFEEQTQIAIPANATSITVNLTGFKPNDQIALRLRAYNEAGRSGASNTARIIIGTKPPAAPTNLVATPKTGAAGRTAVTLTYQDKSTNETGFRIEIAPPGQGFTELGVVIANVRSVVVTKLKPNTSYKFRVRAFNNGGTSAYSNTATVKTRR